MLQTTRKRLATVVARLPSLPYALPFALFIALTALQVDSAASLSWIYPLKTLLVAGTIVLLLPWIPPIVPSHTWGSAALGLVVFVVWILPEGRYPYLGTPGAFDPYTHLSGVTLHGWIALRLVGAVVVVPIVEELFWRGFFIRWIISQDFRKVPIGKFTWPSFLVTSLLFSVEHDRWLVGLAAGILYSLWLYRTRSLYACMVAHGVTNMALGIYVLATRQWSFW